MGSRISRLSLTALGLPGRLMMNVQPADAGHAAREHRVARYLEALRAQRLGDARRFASITRRVASGVTSRGAKPVPPLVRIKLSPAWRPHPQCFSDGGDLVGHDRALADNPVRFRGQDTSQQRTAAILIRPCGSAVADRQ